MDQYEQGTYRKPFNNFSKINIKRKVIMNF